MGVQDSLFRVLSVCFVVGFISPLGESEGVLLIHALSRVFWLEKKKLLKYLSISALLCTFASK